MNYSDFKRLVIILIVCMIAIMIYITVMFSKSATERRNVVNTIVDCYDTDTQCGLHILIEEKELEDPTLDLVTGWLEENTFGQTSSDVEKGKLVVQYMKRLTVLERTKLVDAALELYFRRNLP